MKGVKVQIFPSVSVLIAAAAEEVARRLAALARQRGPDGVVTLCLSGGSTPRALYERLAADHVLREAMPWDRLHLFWGDERHVPPEHPDSNFRMADEAMLSRVPVPPGHVHRMPAEAADAAMAASDYERELATFFRAHGLMTGRWPRFDLALLGMGADGHTASLFPGSDALAEQERLVVAPFVAKLGSHRITLTVPVFNHAAAILFLVAGADKAETLAAVLDGEPGRYPSQLVRPERGERLWLVDAAAAARLAAGTRAGSADGAPLPARHADG